MSSPPVLVVGAGLAGLRCAGLLAEAGHQVKVFEASDGIGGRARTDQVGEFRLDRGFQVLLTAYPELKRSVDLEDLDLGSFDSGAEVRLGDTFSPLLDPVKQPTSLLSAIRSPVFGIADKLRLARMRADLTGTDVSRILEREDLPAIESLRRRGFSEKAIERFFRPFFGGVLIDPELATSSRLMEVFFRCFSVGSATLPAGGMNCLADSLADVIPADAIQLGSKVEAVEKDKIRVGGEWIDGSAVVVATEERMAAGLLGLPDPPAGRATACLYFDGSKADLDGSLLRITPRGHGPVNELAVPSSVAAGYAPPGRSLISVSAVGEAALRPDLEAEVRAQLVGWFGSEAVTGWNHLETYVIEDALPDFAPGRFLAGGLEPELDSGIFICGDHRESPSIQGALVSGRKAAEAVLFRIRG